jgi:hypothetical protein
MLAFFRETQPELPCFLKYIAFDSEYDELERRGAVSPQGRFGPNFDEGWRAGFPELDKLLPNEVDGRVVRATTATLATQAGLSASEGITLATCQALCNMLPALLVAIDTPALRGASNDERARAVGGMLSSKSAGASTSSAGKPAEQDRTKLHDNADFKELKAALERAPSGTPSLRPASWPPPNRRPA